MKRAICEITWQHEGHFHVFLGLAGKKPFPWSDLYTAGPCDLFVLLISRAANCALICRAWASQGNAFVGKDTWTVKFMQTAFEIHAVLTNTGSHFELNYRSGNMNAALQVFLYNCDTQSVGHRNSGSVCKTKVLEVIVCWILGFKLRKVKNRCPCVEQWAKFRRMKSSARRVSVSGQRL